MYQRTSLALGTLAVAMLWTAMAPPAPAVGAPWLTLEMPANPLDPQTRDAALVVHTYWHQRDVGFQPNGTAEGVVDGERQSLPLEFQNTSRTGVYAITQSWPSRGAWILAIELAEGTSTSMLVELGPDGGVSTESEGSMGGKVVSVRSVRVAWEPIRREEIEAILRSMAD